MILKKLSIKAFGKLKDVDIELKPGFNIVYGKNESGKSTLQLFIKAIFYGLKKKTKKNEISEYERYKPWNSNEFAGMIEYEADGKEYKAARNFATEKISVYNELWDDITNEFPMDKKDGPLFAEAHIGMNENFFERSIFIRQLESKISDDSKEIMDRLINLQETGSEEISFKNAAEAIQNTIREKIGNEKTSTKPINIISDEIDNLKKEYNEVKNIKKEVSQIEMQIFQLEREKNEIIEKIDYYKSLKSLQKKEELLEQYNKAKEYEESIEMLANEITRLSQFENFPEHMENRLREIMIEQKNLLQLKDNKQQYLKELEGKIELLSDSSSVAEDGQEAYSTASDYKMMMLAINEKEIKQKELNNFILQLDELNEKAAEYKNTESLDISSQQVIKIEKQQYELAAKIELLDNLAKEYENIKDITPVSQLENENISLEDMEGILVKYRALNEYKDRIELNNREIEKLSSDISRLNEQIKDLVGFDKLPKDIDEHVLKLKEKSSIIDYPSNELKQEKYSYSRKKLVLNSIILFIALLLAGFGIYIMNTIGGIIPYILIGTGILSTLLILVIMGVNIANLKLLAAGNNNDSFAINQDRNSSNQRLSDIFKSVEAEDFSDFMKKLYLYRDISEKLSINIMELNNKKVQNENLKYQLDGASKTILHLLSRYGIKTYDGQISDMHIIALREKFNRVNSLSGLSGQDIINHKERILEDLKRITQNSDADINFMEEILSEYRAKYNELVNRVKELYVELKISSSSEIYEKIKVSTTIAKDIETKNREIEQLRKHIYKLVEDIVNYDSNIKKTLDKYSIEYSKDSVVSGENIENLKKHFEDLSKNLSDITSFKSLKDNLEEEFKEIQQNLDFLEHEKAEILENSLCRTVEEFFEGCSKKEEYDNKSKEKLRITKLYEELTRGEDSHKLLQKVSDISSPFTADAIVFEKIEDIENEISTLEAKLATINEEIIVKNNEIGNKLRGRKELHEIEEKLNFLQEKKKKLIEEKEALEIALEVIQDAGREVQRGFGPKMHDELSTIISKITDGKYSNVKANERLGINVLNNEGKDIIDVNKLSMGTIEQFYLALRISLANIFGEKGSKLPLIIDEAFVQYDDLRVKNVLQFLYSISKERQIIIFSCQKREIELVKEMGIDDINIVEMSA